MLTELLDLELDLVAAGGKNGGHKKDDQKQEAKVRFDDIYVKGDAVIVIGNVGELEVEF